MRKFHFELINETKPKYETFPTRMLVSKHNSECENTTRTNQCMQKFKCERNIKGYQGSKHFKLLFMGARAFIKTTKRCRNPTFGRV
jgi:hypothetical protein